MNTVGGVIRKRSADGLTCGQTSEGISKYLATIAWRGMKIRTLMIVNDFKPQSACSKLSYQFEKQKSRFRYFDHILWHQSIIYSSSPPFFGASGRLCFVTLVFSGYLYLVLNIFDSGDNNNNNNNNKDFIFIWKHN